MKKTIEHKNAFLNIQVITFMNSFISYENVIITFFSKPSNCNKESKNPWFNQVKAKIYFGKCKMEVNIVINLYITFFFFFMRSNIVIKILIKCTFFIAPIVANFWYLVHKIAIKKTVHGQQSNAPTSTPVISCFWRECWWTSHGFSP